MMKTCTICNIEKKSYYFIRGNLKPICKKCKLEKLVTYNKEYRINNKFRILHNNKIYKRNLRCNNPIFRLSNNCSRMINLALNGNKNNYSIWKFLPYSIIDLKIHLEKQFTVQMSWDNYGSYWHVDHIIPQSYFIYSTMEDEDFKKCWALDNLRPLEAIENIKKSNRINYEIK